MSSLLSAYKKMFLIRTAEQEIAALGDYLAEQLLLAVEVVVERALGVACGNRDRIDARPLQAVARDMFRAGFQQSAAGLFTGFGIGAGHTFLIIWVTSHPL